ncbi:LysR family transcriptional regulator [Massilia sp. METH4]|uniref:LysR family transcriptional regulator n=1 Tax=Massilia sp. METH4 TaxID=3123041 RepID=UPI0030D30B72
MRNATLRQLKIFEAVARHLSFSRAAAEMHLTQPAVSTQIRTLEAHVGATLFEQLGKKTYLTQAGSELLPHCRAIILQFEQAEAAMAQHRGITGGRLDVAVISAGDYFFPQLMMAFARRHPGVKLNLTVHNREELLEELAANRTDLAVMVRPPVHDTQNDPFAPHPYVIVAAPQHPLAAPGRAPVPLRELVKYPFVVRERGSDTWHSMEDAFGPRLEELQVAMEIKSTETIKQAVIAGIGLGFLSAHTIGREVAAGSLVVVPAERFPLMLHWYVVHRREKRLPPVASAFRQFLLDDGAEWIGRLIPTAG